MAEAEGGVFVVATTPIAATLGSDKGILVTAAAPEATGGVSFSASLGEASFPRPLGRATLALLLR